mmetsp:Transcript_22322/g.65155  ORF Transcript_22322/g.65155 Transcript_22322/m.65155 type:complete len:305 (+) Transcript_22322:319-1233(+)
MAVAVRGNQRGERLDEGRRVPRRLQPLPKLRGLARGRPPQLLLQRRALLDERAPLDVGRALGRLLVRPAADSRPHGLRRSGRAHTVNDGQVRAKPAADPPHPSRGTDAEAREGAPRDPQAEEGPRARVVGRGDAQQQPERGDAEQKHAQHQGARECNAGPFRPSHERAADLRRQWRRQWRRRWQRRRRQRRRGRRCQRRRRRRWRRTVDFQLTHPARFAADEASLPQATASHLGTAGATLRREIDAVKTERSDGVERACVAEERPGWPWRRCSLRALSSLVAHDASISADEACRPQAIGSHLGL